MYHHTIISASFIWGFICLIVLFHNLLTCSFGVCSFMICFRLHFVYRTILGTIDALQRLFPEEPNDDIVLHEG